MSVVNEAFRLEGEAYLEIHSLLRERINVLEARLMAKLTDEELTALWDSYDGFETADNDISGQMVKGEMLRRGFSL